MVGVGFNPSPHGWGGGKELGCAGEGGGREERRPDRVDEADSRGTASTQRSRRSTQRPQPPLSPAFLGTPVTGGGDAAQGGGRGIFPYFVFPSRRPIIVVF